MKKLLFLALILGSTCLFAQKTEQEQHLLDKIHKVQTQQAAVVKEQTFDKEINSSQQELPQSQDQGIISKVIKEKEQEQLNAEQQNPFPPETAQEPKTQEPKTQENSPSETPKEIKSEQPKGVSLQKQNQDPEGIDWISLLKGKLNVKMQRRTNGISTPNLTLKFQNVYQSLFRNIPWLMGGSADIYVYQNRADFLSHEPVASSWSGAFFSPENNRIVMYDEPDNIKKMLSQFQHELTHLFVENYFCPKNSAKPEPPVWLNEGLAVNMEDITNNAKGGVWANDLIVMNILPSPKGPAANFKLPQPVSESSAQFIKFSDFTNNNSYDSAVAAGKVEDWYLQAYAMVRFLFKPYNNQYPEKRIQFEQFTKLLNTYHNKKDTKGKLLKDEKGRQVKARTSLAAALKQAYGFNSIDDFETKFWQWLYSYQAEQRAKLND